MAEHPITVEVITTAPPSSVASPVKNGRQRAAPRKSKSGRKSKVQPISVSKKSASTGKVKAHPKLKRILRRGGHYRLVEERDARWLYAAYKKGSFKEIERDLTPQEFIDRFIDNTQIADKIYIPVAQTKRGEIPVGVVLLLEKNAIDLHAEWLPWASDRNILESSVRIIHDLKKDYNIVITISEKRDHFIHLCRYGLLRSVGKLYNYFDNETAHIFQSVR